MQVSKIGAVFLVSTLALAGIGASYAGLFDEINIHGEVSTAYVDFEIDHYSGTWVWKDPTLVDENEIAIFDGVYDPTLFPYPEDKAIAWAKGMDSADPVYDGIVKFWNIFPLTAGFVPDRLVDPDTGLAYWVADLSFHYIGSIPIHINNYPYDPNLFVDWLEVTDPDTDEVIAADFESWLESYGGDVVVELYFRQTSVDPDAIREVLTPCKQLHYCDHVDIIVKIAIPQPDLLITNQKLQNIEATGMIDIPTIQWNEYQCEEEQPEKNYENIPEKACTQIQYMNYVGSYWKVDTYDTIPIPPTDGWNLNIGNGNNDGTNPANWDSYGWCVDSAHTLPLYGDFCGEGLRTKLFSSLNHLSTDSDEWPQLYNPTDTNTYEYNFLWGNEHDDPLTPEDEDPATPNTPKYDMTGETRDGYSMNWPCINFIINHWRNGDFDTWLGTTVSAVAIQNAIWWYCDGVIWTGIGATAQDVVEYTNGAVSQTWWDNFPNDDETWFAVLLDFHNSIEKQFIFIEVDP